MAKAWACPAARLTTIFRFMLLLLSLGRSSFCSWAKEELILCSAITFFTSVVEPSTKIFRIVLPPGRDEKPFLKQVGRIMERQIVTMARETREIPEKED